MPLTIALMRSIVVNRQRVKMADARGLLEACGARNVGSLGSTGNFVFETRRSPARMQSCFERAIEDFYGRSTECIIKSAREWQALMAANPMPREAADAPERLLVWAMREPLSDAGLAQLRRRAVGRERVERVSSGDFFVWFGEEPIAASKIPAGFGLRALGAVGTNRNWNTATRILDATQASS